MIKFLKRNTIISIFAVVSFVIVFSYALTYNQPDYFGIEGWYSLFNNLSISYIAAFFFYILQVYLPECENSKEAQIILEPLFLDLIKFIEVTISCCRKYVYVNEDGIITIDWHNKDKKILYFVPVMKESNEGHRPAIRKSEIEIRELDNIFKTKIREIKERIDFRSCDPDVLSVLSKLEATDFFKTTINVALMFEGTFVKFPGFQNQVNVFEILKDEFKKSCGITCEFEVREAEKLEIATCEAIYYKNALSATSIDKFNEITYKEYLKIQLEPLIENEEQLNKIIDEILGKVFESND